MKRIFLTLGVVICALGSLSAQVFYKVSGNGLENPSWIFGTHHLAPLSILDSIPSAKDALNNSQTVVGEIDMTMGQMALASALQPFMMAPSDSTLTKIIKPEDFARISKKFTKYAPMPGMTLEAFDPMRPMVVSSMVSIGIISELMPGYNPQEQLDTYFQTTAKNANKKVKGLETPEMQGKLLYTTTPITKQASDLVDLLDNTEKVATQAKVLNSSYMAQDIDNLLKLTEGEDSDPQFMEALLDRRNADWLTKLPEILKNGNNFIAVGALHLVGDKGIIEGLRKLGYTVEPIFK